jgi:hypothetical protein
MPWPYLHAYAAILMVLVTAWHAAAGNLGKAVLAGACCVAFGMLAAMAAKMPWAPQPAMAAGLPWWRYLTRGERAMVAGGMVVWAAVWAVIWAIVAR